LLKKNLEKGAFKVILGPSGCGKSTLLRYIAGLQIPTIGEVFINEEPRNKNHHVGMVFQKYSSFPWRSVLQNVYYGLEIQNTFSSRIYNKYFWFLKSLPFFKRFFNENIIYKKEMKSRAMEMNKSNWS